MDILTWSPASRAQSVISTKTVILSLAPRIAQQWSGCLHPETRPSLATMEVSGGMHSLGQGMSVSLLGLFWLLFWQC